MGLTVDKLEDPLIKLVHEHCNDYQHVKNLNMLIVVTCAA